MMPTAGKASREPEREQILDLTLEWLDQTMSIPLAAARLLSYINQISLLSKQTELAFLSLQYK